MLDKGTGEVSLSPLWVAFGHRAAVTVGAFTALTSLLWHVPILVSTGRGALAWLAVVVLTRAGAWLLDRTAPPDVDEAETETVSLEQE